MVGFAPMPLVDDFILQYNFGQAVLLLFLLTLPAGLVKGSRKLVALVFVAFGGLFIAVPSIDSDSGVVFAMLGIALMVVGPVVFATAER